MGKSEEEGQSTNLNFTQHKHSLDEFSWKKQSGRLKVAMQRRRCKGGWRQERSAGKAQVIDAPKTTCVPSRKSHLVHVMKNWQPLVSLPLLAWTTEGGGRGKRRLARAPPCYRARAHPEVRAPKARPYHGEHAGSLVLVHKVFVGEGATVDAGNASAVKLREREKEEGPSSCQRRSTAGAREERQQEQGQRKKKSP